MAAATAAEAQALVADSKGYQCYLSPGLAWYGVLAALLDVAAGGSVPDAPTLAAETKCLQCYIAPGMLPYPVIQAMAGSSGGGRGGSTLCGSGPPVAPPSGAGALYIDTDDGTIYEFYSGAWH